MNHLAALSWALALEERGACASVVLFCVRPDLKELGESIVRSFQAVFKLIEDFRLAIGLESWAPTYSV